MSILTSSQLTFQDLKDSYHIQITPDYIALACDENGAVVNTVTQNISFGTYIGANRIGTSAFTSNNVPAGVTVYLSSHSTTSSNGSIQIQIASGTILDGQATASFKISLCSNDGENFIFEKYITLIKSVIGATGATGNDGKSYWMNFDTSSIKRNLGGVYTPSQITINSMSRAGVNNASGYSCRFKIEESTDGVNYTTTYTSSSNENTLTYTPTGNTIYDNSNGVAVTSQYYSVNGETLTITNASNTLGVKAVRISMYAAGGMTTLLDQKVIPVVSDGDDGAPGTSAMTFAIYSPDGDTFHNNEGTITLRTMAYNGVTEILSGTYLWYKYVNSQWEVVTETVLEDGNEVTTNCTDDTLEVSGIDVVNVQTYKCVLTYNSLQYDAYYTLVDIYDIYTSEIKTLGGNIINSQKSNIITYVAIYKNGEEIDPLVGEIWTRTSNPSVQGDYYRVHNGQIILQYYDGSTWSNSSIHQIYQYSWNKIQYDNSINNIELQTKVILLNSNYINGASTIECVISDNSLMAVSKCQSTFIDINDPVVGNAPSSPKIGQLWVDTSTVPSSIKIYNGTSWELSRAYNNDGANIFISKPNEQLTDGYCYNVGDLWVVGDDYYDNNKFSKKALLICINANTLYADDDWEDITNYNKNILDLKNRTAVIEDHVVIDSNGVRINGVTEQGEIPFYTKLTSTELGFWEHPIGQQGDSNDAKVVWISNQEMHSKTATIDGSLTVNDINALPFIKLGLLKLQQESDGSFSITK